MPTNKVGFSDMWEYNWLNDLADTNDSWLSAVNEPRFAAFHEISKSKWRPEVAGDFSLSLSLWLYGAAVCRVVRLSPGNPRSSHADCCCLTGEPRRISS